MWVCFIAYLLFLAYLLFFSTYFGRTEYGEGEYRYNLTLFQEIERYYRYGMRTGSWQLFVLNVCGNIGVFIPIGAFLPALFKRCEKMFFTTLICLEISLLAEVIQIISRVGSFDVDDLLLNTVGGFLGYVLYRIWMINKRIQSKGKKSRK